MPEILHTPTPKARQILLIIFLGALFMLLTQKLLVADIRLSDYKKEYVAVNDSDKVIDNAKVSTVDTVTVIYHGAFRAHTSKPGHIKTVTEVPYKSLFFEYNSVFLVWMSIISIMMGISMAVAPVIVKAIRDIIHVFNLKRLIVWQSVGVVLLIGAAIAFMQQNGYMMQAFSIMKNFRILLYHPRWVNIIIMANLAVGLMAIAGQLLINSAISKLPDNIADLSDAEQKKEAGRFTLLRNQLKFFLLIDAVLIVFSILTTDALRRSILAEISFNIDIFPANFVYLYGLLFTFFLGLLYMPIYYRLRYKGATMLYDIPQQDLDGVKKPILTALLIQETPMQSLQVALTILAPVLTSLAPNILKI